MKTVIEQEDENSLKNYEAAYQQLKKREKLFKRISNIILFVIFITIILLLFSLAAKV